MTRARKSRAQHGPVSNDDLSGGEPEFSFIPEELSRRYERLIRAYHALPGAPHLADLMWRSEARAFIITHNALHKILIVSARVRSARRTNDRLRMIAKIILAMKVLSNDFAGWGTRFPDAKRQAETILRAAPFTSGMCMMDYYLSQSLDSRCDIIRMLAPSWGE